MRVKRLWSASAIAIAVGACGNPEPVEPPAFTEPRAPWGAPITGGTMLITRDGKRAVIADPDRDRIVTVDLTRDLVIESVSLDEGTGPGRLVEDGAGRVHVALRGSGELLTLGPERHRRAICGEPRGVAWEVTTDLVHIACATGELVSVPAAGGDPVRVLHLQRDLRDVLVRRGGLVVSTFRSAELLTLDATGAVVARAQPPIVRRLDLGPVCSGAPCILLDDGKVDAIAAVAWRTIALSDGSVVMSHQRKLDLELELGGSGYSGSCSGPAQSAITVFSPSGVPFAAAPSVFGALPVDVAVNPAGNTLAFVTAGDQSVHVLPSSSLLTPDDNECGDFDGSVVTRLQDWLGAPTSVAYAPGGDLVIYYPELPALVIRSSGVARTVRLPGELGYDAGRALFHEQAGVGIACASCHPEGRDDGQVWKFVALGARRTQSLAGGITYRAPYHWIGDMVDLPTLMDDVFTNRMFGGEVTSSQRLSLGPWLDRIAAPAGAAVDPARVQRGQTLFMAADTQCTTCHTGPLYTNNKLVDVGTGGVFKVPSLLGVGARAPFIHDGCAATLRDRFGVCGGGDRHGVTSHLTEAQLSDLVGYLESL